MSLDDLLSVTISANTQTPTQPGFGVPLVLTYHSLFTDQVRTYSSVAAMVSDGFLTTDPAYLAAAAIKAQNPTVPQFKIGRRHSKPIQSVTLTVTLGVNGDVFAVTVNGTTATHTQTGGDTASSIATALASAIDADPQAAASATGAVITVTVQGSPNPADAYLNRFKNWTPNIAIADNTPDPGIAADLALCLAADSNWYGLALDSQGKAEVEAAAAWVETNKKLFCFNNSDSADFDSGSSTDVFAALKTSAYARTGGFFCGSDTGCYSGAAMLGNRLWDTPGDDTWQWKTLAGIPVDNLSETQFTNLRNKLAMVYVPLAGLNLTVGGNTSSGAFYDITRFVDWLQATIQIRLLSLFANNKKIPFTDLGVDMVKSVISGALVDGVNAGGLVKGTTSVSAPLVSAVDAVNKGARNLPNVTFSGQLAGAIHTLTVQGTVTL